MSENDCMRGYVRVTRPQFKECTNLDLESPDSPLSHCTRRPTRLTAAATTTGQCFGPEYCFF